MVFEVQRVDKFNPAIGSMKILLLEDDTTQRSLIKRMLNPYDCEFFEAETPAEAWKHVESEKIDFAIIDIYLPGEEGDGIQFMSKLRKKTNNEYLPILMISGSPSRTAVKIAQEHSCLKFLTKPLDEEKLIETIRRTGQLRMSAFEHKKELEVAPGPVLLWLPAAFLDRSRAPRNLRHPGNTGQAVSRGRAGTDRTPDLPIGLRALRATRYWRTRPGSEAGASSVGDAP